MYRIVPPVLLLYCCQVVEGYIKLMDAKLKGLMATMESRFASLNENLFGLHAEPVTPGRCGRGK